MSHRTKALLSKFLNPLTAILAILCPLALEAQSIAPQDSMVKEPVVTITADASDGSFSKMLLRTVAGTDLVYYTFLDTTNQRRGIRARDLDGTLVYEILSPNYSGAVYYFDVAANGTVYAIETQGSSLYYIYVYTLSGGPPGTYSQTDVWGRGGTGDTTSFPSGIASRAIFKVSPVTGNVYVKEDRRVNNTDLLAGGEILVYDAAGSPQAPIQVNGILAPTLEGGIYELYVVPGHDGTGQLWVRGAYGRQNLLDSRSQWFKLFSESTGGFERLFDVNSGTFASIHRDMAYLSISGGVSMTPITAGNISQYTGRYYGGLTSSSLLGKDSLGRIVMPGNNLFRVYESPVFRTFDPRDQNAIPNPVVSKIEQRAGFTILDIDYRVEDSDDATVTTAAVALPDGTLNLLNALPMTTFTDGTGSNLGAGIATNTRTTLSWNAGADWNVDFGDISVLVLARDSRTRYFDIHLVDIPADGLRPAVTISRNPLQEYDFTMQWLWLIARADPAISFTGGIITGTAAAGPAYDGQQLTDGSGNSTSLGRDYLLERDGLRIATAAEVLRAREGATEGFIVQLTPPNLIYTVGRPSLTLPRRINEYGVESTNDGGNRGSGSVIPTGFMYYSGPNTNLWHVVPTGP